MLAADDTSAICQTAPDVQRYDSLSDPLDGKCTCITTHCCELLLLCQVLSNDGSGEFRMTEGVQGDIMAAVTSFGSQQALRCLALAYKTTSAAVDKVRVAARCSPNFQVSSLLLIQPTCTGSASNVCKVSASVHVHTCEHLLFARGSAIIGVAVQHDVLTMLLISSC